MARYEITNLPGGIDFEITDDNVRRTVQNCKNLLMCQMGEIPFDRQRGFNTDLYDLTLEEMRTVLLPELDRIMLWEPDADVVSATAEIGTEDYFTIRCVVEILI